MFLEHSLDLDWLPLNVHSGFGFKLQGTEDSYNFVVVISKVIILILLVLVVEALVLVVVVLVQQ